MTNTMKVDHRGLNHAKKMKSRKKFNRNIFILICVGIPFLLYSIFMIYPTFNVFSNSFFQWSGLSPTKTFIKLDNYKTLLKETKFIQAFWNTLFLMGVTTVVTMSISLFLATVLTQSKLKEKNIYRVLFFFPNVLSVVVIGIIFRYIYAPNNGILNAALDMINIKGPVWLGNEHTVLWAISGAMIWQAVGYYMVIYMAGIDSISPALFEAADIDGATKSQQFRKITIPMLWEIIRVTLVFFIVSSLNMSFLFVTVMTQGGPNGGSEVLLSYMYKQAFSNGNFGYAMAVAVVVFVFTFILAIISNIITSKKEDK